MKEHYDPWFVRLPDGRTIRAKSTASVRHHIEAGHIPLNSLVRRDSSEEWASLVWVAEFADFGTSQGRLQTASPANGLAHSRSGISVRLDPMRLQTVGIRGLIDELMAALDSTLSRSKLLPAFLAGIVLYTGFVFAPGFVGLFVDAAEHPQAGLVAGSVLAILVLSLLNAFLVRLTHLELSSMRPARFSEGSKGFAGFAGAAWLANVAIAGTSLALLLLVRELPGWMDRSLADSSLKPEVRDWLALPVRAAAAFLAVLLWIIVGLCWLLTPAIVVEDSSWIGGIREWRQLLREHLGRAIMYEGLTVLLGLAISLPLALACGLALDGRPSLSPNPPWGTETGLGGPTALVHAALHGISAAPLLALLPVANVFIYLNLRYEQAHTRD